MAIKVKKTTLSVSDILGLYGGDEIILPAPPSGSVNNILGVSWAMTFVTTPWETGVTWRCYSDNISASYIYTSNTNYQSSANMSGTFAKATAGVLPFVTTQNFYITVNNGSLSAGDSPIDIFVIYETVVLDV